MRHRNVIRAVAVAAALGLSAAFSAPALAIPFADGDVITYTHGSFGADPLPTNGAGVLAANYSAVYASTFGVVEIGIPGASGFSITFTNYFSVLAYLPQGGSAAALTSDFINPAATMSGVFGGDVLALQLNVDLADAGVTLGAIGVRFGDLVLYNLTAQPLLNGLTVRQVLDQANTVLGGGTASYSLAEMDLLLDELNGSFSAGIVRPFANNHLRLPGPIAQVPEPSTLALLGTGLLGLGGAAWWRRRRT